MDKLKQLSAYITAYRAAARQLRDRPIAREWMETGTPADVAAQWANLGYLPTEAADLIAAGQTPEMVAEIQAATSTGDPVADLATALAMTTGEPVDPDAAAAIVERAELDAIARQVDAEHPWGIAPRVDPVRQSDPGEIAEAIAALSVGASSEHVVWLGVDAGAIAAHLRGGTVLHCDAVGGTGWHVPDPA